MDETRRDQTRNRRGRTAQSRGTAAEAACAARLAAEGFTLLGARLRTGAGEIDLLARRGALTVVVEVKARPAVADAAYAISPRQRARLCAAAEALMATHPHWFGDDLRFDAMFVTADGTITWLADAFRPGE